MQSAGSDGAALPSARSAFPKSGNCTIQLDPQTDVSRGEMVDAVNARTKWKVGDKSRC